jgi:protein SCO1/2
MKLLVVTLSLGVAAAAAAQPNRMQGMPGGGGYISPGTPSTSVPDLLAKVGIDQKLGARLPLDAEFRSEDGRQVPLRSLFRGRPVVLALVYYECPMLCTQVLNGAVGAFKTLNFTAGREFDVVTISFDPRETPAMAAQKKVTYLNKYGRPEAAPGWHFLTGDKAAIDAVAGAVGFRYVYDEASNQYVHASALMVVTPDGHVSKYFYGIEYAPRDLRLGLVEASNGAIGTPVDQVLLYCYHYDPGAGTYSMVVMNVLRLAALTTLALIGGFIVVMTRRDRRKPKTAAA